MREPEKKEVTIKVPVRADIAGAFSDLAYYLDKYGIERGEVTNISLPVYITAKASISDENANMVVKLPDLNQEIEGDIEELEKQENNNVSEILRHFIKLFDLNINGLNLEVNGGGKIPPASGLGTSSAAGVAVIMAISQLYGLYGINPCELNYIVELAMGVMGGKQDYYAAWVRGLNNFEFFGPNKSMVGLRNHLDEESKQYKWVIEHSVVYFTGHSRSSGETNIKPEDKIASDPDILSRIAKVAAGAWQAITVMDEIKVKDAIIKDRDNRLELSSIYYSNIMHKMGSVADKLGYAHRGCGAGNGGCMLFFGDPKNHDQLERELKKIGGWRVV